MDGDDLIETEIRCIRAAKNLNKIHHWNPIAILKIATTYELESRLKELAELLHKSLPHVPSAKLLTYINNVILKLDQGDNSKLIKNEDQKKELEQLLLPSIGENSFGFRKDKRLRLILAGIIAFQHKDKTSNLTELNLIEAAELIVRRNNGNEGYNFAGMLDDIEELREKFDLDVLSHKPEYDGMGNVYGMFDPCDKFDDKGIDYGDFSTFPPGFELYFD